MWIKKKPEAPKPGPSVAHPDHATQIRALLRDPEVKESMKNIVGSIRARVLLEMETAPERQLLVLQGKLLQLRQFDDLLSLIDNELERYRNGHGSWLIQK